MGSFFQIINIIILTFSFSLILCLFFFFFSYYTHFLSFFFILYCCPPMRLFLMNIGVFACQHLSSNPKRETLEGLDFFFPDSINIQFSLAMIAFNFTI